MWTLLGIPKTWKPTSSYSPAKKFHLLERVAIVDMPVQYEKLESQADRCARLIVKLVKLVRLVKPVRRVR